MLTSPVLWFTSTTYGTARFRGIIIRSSTVKPTPRASARTEMRDILTLTAESAARVFRSACSAEAGDAMGSLAIRLNACKLTNIDGSCYHITQRIKEISDVFEARMADRRHRKRRTHPVHRHHVALHRPSEPPRQHCSHGRTLALDHSSTGRCEHRARRCFLRPRRH